MARNALGVIIAKQAANLGGYVFGGYVRDLIAKDRFNDIDIYLGADPINVKIFVNALKNHGFNVKPKSAGALYVPGLEREKYRVSSTTTGKNTLYVDIDCVTSSDGINSPFRKGLDVDVNFLYYDGCSLRFGAAPWIDIVEAKNHIINRQFVAEETVSKHRISKMLAKGYTQIGATENATQATTISWVKAVKPSVCPECQGTGKLDFGFYVRSCKCQEHNW